MRLDTELLFIRFCRKMLQEYKHTDTAAELYLVRKFYYIYSIDTRTCIVTRIFRSRIKKRTGLYNNKEEPSNGTRMRAIVGWALGVFEIERNEYTLYACLKCCECAYPATGRIFY